jgi:signal transduction histidine kinase
VCAREDSMCAQVFLRGETTVVPDASRDPLFQDHPFVTGRVAAIRFYASVPLTTAAGFVLGSLCVFSPDTAELPPDKQAALEIIASQVVEVFELQHHARMLARSLDEARTSNALLESFAARISHDLRNPLTSVIGFTELGELRSPADAEDFRIIGRTSRRMLAMVDDILSFSRIGGALRPGPVSLAALVHGVEEDLAFSLRAAGAEIAVADTILQADAEQLRVLLQNLIQNAVAYRRPDVPPRIQVTADAVGDGVAVRVSDNGKGIPAQERSNVMEPLVRLHRADDPPGFGLGLATCVRIAQAHGGRLEISSAPGGGTAVSAILRAPVLPGSTPAAV